MSSCSNRLTAGCSPSSDLNEVISNSLWVFPSPPLQEIKPSMSPPPLPPPPVKNETIGRKVERAQLVESKTNEIMRSLVKFKDSVSEDGESAE
ncbi:hypothetical protein OIU74_012792 [Salix koriyanagi]|uniref:Uncharacterized protein n=1 Tax=Salix koriyanagi TaxID=2511006 RepID=A0A9Q0Q8A9_9ROSI|nr:hypothetical protein OIU74_012792 [Salix koriyanagi]